MPQEYQLPDRVYKYPFELIMLVSFLSSLHLITWNAGNLQLASYFDLLTRFIQKARTIASLGVAVFKEVTAVYILLY